jgi:hypothetical protein
MRVKFFPPGLFRQGKYLKEPAVEGDEVLLDQFVAGLQVFVENQSQQRADAVIAIERKPLAICRQNQKNVEQ